MELPKTKVACFKQQVRTCTSEEESAIMAVDLGTKRERERKCFFGKTTGDRKRYRQPSRKN